MFIWSAMLLHYNNNVKYCFIKTVNSETAFVSLVLDFFVWWSILFMINDNVFIRDNVLSLYVWFEPKILTTHPLRRRGLLTAWYSDMPSVFLIWKSRLAMAFVGLYLGGPGSGFTILGGKIMSRCWPFLQYIYQIIIL